jgi:hypothetical protein
MKSVKATDVLLTQMNTKEKDIITKPFIKTLHTTLACLVATSAFALDDRLDSPMPQDEPDPKTPGKTETPRPDLVPLGLNLTPDNENAEWRNYTGIATVANFGTADAKAFLCHVGFRVLSTNDPVKWPVGKTMYTGGMSFADGLQVMDIQDQPTGWFGLSVPKAVTGAEICLVVDHLVDSPTFDDNWDNDTGMDLIGDIVELDENNNILGGKKVYYVEYQEPKIEVSVPKGITLKPRN